MDEKFWFNVLIILIVIILVVGVSGGGYLLVKNQNEENNELGEKVCSRKMMDFVEYRGPVFGDNNRVKCLDEDGDFHSFLGR